MRYLFLDCETGGLNPRETSLLELSLLLVDGEKPVDDLTSMWRLLTLKTIPMGGVYRVTPDALNVNKIDISNRGNNVLNYFDAGLEIRNFLLPYITKEKFIVAGWNVQFDLGFIYEHLFDKATWDKLVGYRCLDVQSVAKFLTDVNYIQPKKNSLVGVADYLGIDTTGAHSSAADTVMTYNVFLKLKNTFKGVAI